MDLKTIYDMMQGDYEDVMARLRKEDRIKKYLLKYKDQDMVGNIKAALDAGESEAAFMHAHTLKGLCANLSLTRLAESASELTENLRDGSLKEDTPDLYERVRQDDELVKKALDAL